MACVTKKRGRWAVGFLRPTRQTPVEGSAKRLDQGTGAQAAARNRGPG